MMDAQEQTSSPVSSARDSFQLLTIKVANVLACIDLTHVERTFSLVDIKPMPGSAPYVVGILNYAGSSLPVIDLAIRLGLPSANYQLDTPIMVCTDGQKSVGVIVQDIVGVQAVDMQEFQLADELGSFGSAFTASVHTEPGLAFMLNVPWLTQSELYLTAASAGN